jgi:hypothetical protein
MGERLDVEDESYGLIVVSRWRVHEPDERKWRWRFAVAFDILLHLFVTAMLFGAFLVGHPDAPDWVSFLALVGCYLAVSFAHRVFLQWAWRSTIGKLLLGVVLVRADTRGRPLLRRLVSAWLGSVLLTFGTALDGL